MDETLGERRMNCIQQHLLFFECFRERWIFDENLHVAGRTHCEPSPTGSPVHRLVHTEDASTINPIVSFQVHGGFLIQQSKEASSSSLKRDEERRQRSLPRER